MEGRRGVGSYQGGRSVGSERKTFGNDLHRKNTGDSVTVGGAAANIRGMHKGDRL